jgi:hypothetical protein
MMKVIFAPHVDDELIGCYSILRDDPENCFICYCETPTHERAEEASQVSQRLQIPILFPVAEHVDEFIKGQVRRDGDCTFLAPDPHWEPHPFHKRVGGLVHRAVERWGEMRRFVTYSTAMNTPYIRELPSPSSIAKRVLLDELYPSQADLWRYDHRYFLFEGKSEWNPPLV